LPAKAVLQKIRPALPAASLIIPACGPKNSLPPNAGIITGSVAKPADSAVIASLEDRFFKSPYEIPCDREMPREQSPRFLLICITATTGRLEPRRRLR
jgi:hypothetical protein